MSVHKLYSAVLARPCLLTMSATQLLLLGGEQIVLGHRSRGNAPELMYECL